MRKSLLGLYLRSTSVLLAAIGAAPLAMAQSAPGTTSSEEIVITATGRATALQDVPVAVTAVSNETIKNAGITDVKNLQQVVASYKVGSSVSNSANTTISVRGIGTSSANPGFEAAVGVFVDGVFRSRSGAALADLPPVDRIEVLRGPQGTLFGVNTSAGAVSVTTSAPEQAFSAYGSLEGGDYHWIKSALGITGGVTDNLALRLDIGSQYREGFETDVNSGDDVNTRDRYFVRGQALFDNHNNLVGRLILDTAHADENCCVPVIIRDGATSPALNLIAFTEGLTGSPAIASEQRKVAYTPGRPSLDTTDESGVSGELNWTVGGVKLTSITAYRNWDAHLSSDIDYNGADAFFRQGDHEQFKTFTQEFRVQGKKGRLDWLGGLFYLNEKTDYKPGIQTAKDFAGYIDVLASAATPVSATCDPSTAVFAGCLSLFRQAPGQSGVTPLLFANDPTLVGIFGATAMQNYADAVFAAAPAAGQGQQSEQANVTAKSFAAFTHNEIALTDKLNLTLGLRFTHETKDVTADLNATAPVCDVLQDTSQLPGAAVGVTYNTVSSAIFSNPTAATLFLLSCNPVANTIANGTYAGGISENEWSGIASLKYDFTNDINAYLTYSRGYKAGGFNLDRSAFNMTPVSTVKPSVNDWAFNPEFTDNYEFGVKSRLPLRTTANLAIFYEHIKGYQDNEFLGTNYKAFNVPSVISKGAEIDLTTHPFESLTLSGNAIYNEAYYDGAFTLSPTAGTIPDGLRLGGTSKYTGNLSATYDLPLAGTNLGLQFYLNGRYVSRYRIGAVVGSLQTDTQPGFGLLSGRISLGERGDRTWSVELWGENLLDKYYLLGEFNPPFEANVAGIIGDPRTYGVTVRAKF
jgi:outer membrane receptor protein involved in Fe transport